MAKPRVKELVLHMDHCAQCIRSRLEYRESGDYLNRCYGDVFKPREFTEAEHKAFRGGTLSIPDWCPLPDAVEVTE